MPSLNKQQLGKVGDVHNYAQSYHWDTVKVQLQKQTIIFGSLGENGQNIFHVNLTHCESNQHE